MPELTGAELGDRLRKLRRERGMTQEELAARSGISQIMIARTEQGKRFPRLPGLTKLATALDVSLSELLDKQPRLGADRDGASVLALRDVLLSPSLLPGLTPDDDAEPPSPAVLDSGLAQAAAAYREGRFAELAAMLPHLITDARLAARMDPVRSARPLALTCDLIAGLLVHFGRDDLAAVGASQAVTAAAAGNDELLHATEEGTYAWVLHHQGRMNEAEQLATHAAQQIQPPFTAPPEHLAAWGNLLMTALAPAAAAGHDISEYISLAQAAATRLGRRQHIYLTSFGPPSVATQAVHAHAVMRQPAKALKAARAIRPGDLTGIYQGRHLLDIAQAHTDARHDQTATHTLTHARALAPTWFAHQGIARTLTAELTHRARRLTPELRDLAISTTAPGGYTPYHRTSP
ncbi:MAG TPA: helix-turn-helix transcriptional regulator [Streptosporangiaceae bacterium]|jgi:transcriptional regulator with XRE-family HTH domain